MNLSLRHRKNVDYSSEGTSSSIFTVRSASKWDENAVLHMNIKVVDDNIVLPNEAHGNLSNEAQSILIPEWTNKEWLIDANIAPYSNKIRSLMRKIKKVSINLENAAEFMVDGFVSSLLNILCFDDDPCLLYPQYKYLVNIGSPQNGNSCIRAMPDFSVITDSYNIILVIEDKNVTSATYSNGWKENQVIGELFVVVHYIAARPNKKATFPINVYAVRVIGTKFTFYKATATHQYIIESAKYGKSEKNEMVVQRHPPVEDTTSLTAYDICDGQDRKHILELLCHIKTLMV